MRWLLAAFGAWWLRNICGPDPTTEQLDGSDRFDVFPEDGCQEPGCNCVQVTRDFLKQQALAAADFQLWEIEFGVDR